MARFVNPKARRQAANLNINSDLLKVACDSGVNLSAVLEEALTYRVAVAKREAWVRENTEAIANYNDFVEENGIFSDGNRGF